MSSAPSVQIIVCCHELNRWAVLTDCIDELLRQIAARDNSPPSSRAELIIVVDHAPALLDLCRRTFGSMATIVASSYPAGLSGARNTGLDHCTAEIVAFVDDDAVPQSGWLDSLVSEFTDPDLMLAGGQVFPVWPDHRRPRWFPPEFGWVVGCDYSGMPPVGCAVRNPIGANMFGRLELILQAGGFQTGVGRVGQDAAGADETHLAIKMAELHPDLVIRRIAGAPVDHQVSLDRCTLRYFTRRCLAEGRSKADLTKLTGANSALSAERDHLVLLARTVGRDLLGVFRGDLWGPIRALSIALGTLLTVIGWSGRRIRQPRLNSSPAQYDSASMPTIVADLDTAANTVSMTPVPPGTTSIQLLSRVNRRPTEQAPVTLHPDTTPHDQILDHLRRLAAADPVRHTQPPAAQSTVPPGADRSTTVAAVVCTIGRNPVLPSTIDLILNHQTKRVDELIVVDNDPQSGRVRQALRPLRDDPRIRIVSEPRPGVASARNAAIAAATATVLAFTDDDVEPEHDWLEQLVHVFDVGERANTTVTCVTGLVIAADIGRQVHQWFEQSCGFERGLAPMVWDPDPQSRLLEAMLATDSHTRVGRQGAAFPVAGSEFGSGNNMAFRREWLLTHGGFDMDLGTGTPARGGEDLDMFRRVILRGGSLIYQPSAIVRHHHRDTVVALRRQLYDYGVGMSANVTAHMLSGPRGTARTLRVLPGGLRLLLDPRSDKNSGKVASYPATLNLIEILGYLTGPVHLMASRLSRRRYR